MNKPQLQFAQVTNQTPGLELDQDVLLALTMHGASDFGVTEIGFFMIANSPGSSEDSIKAAELSVQTVAQEITRQIYMPLVSDSTNGGGIALHEMLDSAFQQANRVLLNQYPDNATSAAAMLVIGEKVYTANSGDICIFLVTENAVEVLTQSDVVSELIQQRQMREDDPDEAKAIEPERLLRGLGMTETLAVDYSEHLLPRNAWLVLYHSGLPAWRVMEIAETGNSIQQIILQQPNLKRASEMLIALARSQEARDDISVILVKSSD